MFGNAKSCWHSLPRITKATSLSESSARRGKQELVQNGWLSEEWKGKQSPTLSILTPVRVTPPPTVTPVSVTPLSEGQAPPVTVTPEAVNESVKNIHRFKPPTVEDVRGYCEEKNYTIDPETFVDWNSSKGWMIGKNKMKDWKAAVRTWQKREQSNGQRRPSGKPHSQRGPEVVNLSHLIDTGNDIVG